MHSAPALRPLGPFARAVREALEGAAPHERARAALLDSLADASLVTVPEDLEAFRAFARGSLDVTVRRMLGIGAAELVRERLGHILSMATTSVARASRFDDEEPSAEHVVAHGPTSAARSSGVTRRALSDAAQQAVREVHEAKTLPPPPPLPRARASAASTLTGLARPAPRRAAVTQAVAVAGGVREVLVITLDATLVASMSTTLGAGARVTGIASVVELTRAIAMTRQRLSLVLDLALSAIDMPTFASFASALPEGSRVVLWGTNERQRARLAVSFPCARDWIASQGLEPALDVLGEG